MHFKCVTAGRWNRGGFAGKFHRSLEHEGNNPE